MGQNVINGKPVFIYPLPLMKGAAGNSDVGLRHLLAGMEMVKKSSAAVTFPPGKVALV